ncbi:DUF1569 domain-containing protein [Mucilaginibacter sp. cycad4]|uniref:DUF1569 domain-containing protein n=1 Tax=Mucilaginibacter sp. cycad4 TaxID=3342096 RepID=UPI002AABF3B5|nr:DUF1569 domain-containing protein [Mucilaginibacter gossypii]WPU99126.1 DUF1569 domain-containing protein [Mucilaginibacter gossypii]
METVTAKKPKMKRSIISARLFASAWAIVRYIPKSFFAPRIDGLNFFKPERIAEFVARVEKVSPDSKRQWGTMEPEQMLHHLNLAVGAGIGFYDLPDESYLLSRTFFRWVLVDWFPEQPVGLRLPLNFVIKPFEHFNFQVEKTQLIKIIQAAGSTRTAADWGPHPMFGKMSYKEWGKLLDIHIDYHLRQFGV